MSEPRGNLIDAQDNLLESDCTLPEAIDWLRRFNVGNGWRGGDTAWCPDDAGPCTIISEPDTEHAVTWRMRR